ncbi:uncharacterized protein [Spinacia oleracea]|uniref:Reverse transcriptase zinc-binding domain-containing protein n=1 Tax=Spinacia oleracea TaxID=3562 RepID=A0ABM3RNZ7_SPIOL|nr:uncharacterized protein LOC130471319 [Spinacia oleracea]
MEFFLLVVATRPMVPWDKMVWNRLNISKYMFICWLAFQCRLQTTAKFARIGISSFPNCLLCGQDDEEHGHLISRYPYISRCLASLKRWMGIQSSPTTLQRLIRNISHGNGSKFKRNVMYAGVAALVYLVWRSRNCSFWDKAFPTVQNVMNVLKQLVRKMESQSTAENVFAPTILTTSSQVAPLMVPSSLPSMKHKRNALIWQHFTFIEKMEGDKQVCFAQCNYCPKQYKA